MALTVESMTTNITRPFQAAGSKVASRAEVFDKTSITIKENTLSMFMYGVGTLVGIVSSLLSINYPLGAIIVFFSFLIFNYSLGFFVAKSARIKVIETPL